MKTLCLLRHAKSSWNQPGLADFERPLNARGRAACATMAHALRDRGLEPDLVLCSPAARTRETLACILDQTGWAPPVVHPAVLYPGDPGAVLGAIRAVPATAARLLVIGHNPGIHALALHLAAQSADDAARRLAAKFPTAALAVLSFGLTRWRDVAPGQGRLTAFLTPASLAEG